MKKYVDKVKVLIEALPYMKKFGGKTIVIKFGGSTMKNPLIKTTFIEDVALLKLIGINPVIVHGGGPLINEMLEKLHIEPVFHNGLRVTTEETLDVVEMVLSGKINKDIVNEIQKHGFNAVGMSGKDGNTLIAKKKISKDCDLGFVGEIDTVRPEMVLKFIKEGFIRSLHRLE